MRRAVVLMAVLLVGACGGGEDGTSKTSAASTTEQGGEAVVIRTSMTVAATEGAEPIATGEVLEGSTLGGSPFCVGGNILDSHASLDPAMEPYGLVDRTITCPDGTVRVGFTPPTGSWTIVSGTGAFQGLHGSGEVEVTSNPDDALGHETFTGTATR
jgi:hypothetical protein